MMKKCLLTLSVVLILFSAKSQIAKKDWLLGGGFSYYNNNYTQGTQSNSNISPRIGYALGNNSVAGLKGSFSFGKNKDDAGNKNSMESYSANVFWRKYIPIKNKVGWYVETSAGLASGTIRNEYVTGSPDSKVTNKGYNVTLTPGIYYAVSRGILLNADFAGVSYSHNTSESDNGKIKSDYISLNFMNYFSFGIDFIL